jgi:hypothetical protein
MKDFKNRVITWDVPFESGTLKAIARNNGKEETSFELKTTGKPAIISARCDFSVIKADRQDISRIYLNITDEAGNTVYDAINEITCTITGPARLIGMEDANPVNTDDYKDNKQKAFHGKLLVYIQSLDKTGKVNIELSSPGLKSGNIVIDVIK